MPATVRFLKQYLCPADGVVAEAEVMYSRGAEPLPASVFRPAGDLRRLPGWVVLHGLTRAGRSHASLLRFVRALAAAGNVVFVPDIPEWRDLRIAPDITLHTIRDAVRALHQRADVQHDRIGLFGFSFGATQALIASADADTAGLLAGTASWGGYHDLRRLCRFGLTGRHEIDGTTYQTQPDPYGCWIMAGNYLPRVPGREGTDAAARALHDLAIEAGDTGAYAWEPVYDAAKLRLRATLGPRDRTIFDMIAPLTTVRHHDTAALLELAEDIARTALQADPLLDPRPALPHVRVPVVFAHGRDDRLVPFSESIRLARGVPANCIRGLTITSLFQHSGGTQSGLGPIGLTREGARFVSLLRRVLHLI
ncbi:hypothetical protein BH23GEM10_BH23GEM10_02540 [soil metagenome]